MTVLDVIAGMAFFSLDIITLFSLIGSSLYLLGALVARLQRRRYRPSEQVHMWSVGGLVFGTAGLVALVLSDFPQRATFIFNYSWSTIAWMLLGSFVLLLASWMLPARPTRRRYP